jgi:hypothetical protein
MLELKDYLKNIEFSRKSIGINKISVNFNSKENSYLVFVDDYPTLINEDGFSKIKTKDLVIFNDIIYEVCVEYSQLFSMLYSTSKKRSYYLLCLKAI